MTPQTPERSDGLRAEIESRLAEGRRFLAEHISAPDDLDPEVALHILQGVQDSVAIYELALAQLSTPPAVCPYIVHADEGTAYCRLAESNGPASSVSSVTKEDGDWINVRMPRVLCEVGQHMGNSHDVTNFEREIGKFCADAILHLYQERGGK